jgi:hypothetical protein
LFREEARKVLKNVRKEWELKTGGFVLDTDDIQREISQLRDILSGSVSKESNGKGVLMG